MSNGNRFYCQICQKPRPNKERDLRNSTHEICKECSHFTEGNAYYFVKEGGTLYMCNRGEKVQGYTKFAILFDNQDGTLLKYGDPEKIKKYRAHLQAALIAQGGVDLAVGLVTVEGDYFHPLDVNKIVNITGYVAKWAQWQHKLHGPEDHKDYDESDRCQACVLSYCKVCKGAEGSLPHHCPGRSMTEEEDKKVYGGEIDYVDGVWVQLK